MPPIHSLLDAQNWFSERMRALDYRSDPTGIAFGVAYMGGQAILAGEVDAFNHKLKLLQRIAVDQLALKIEEANQELARLARESRVEALRQVKEERANKKNFKGLTATQKRKIVKRVAEILQHKMQQLPEEKRDLLDMQPFLDGVELYHQAYIYPHLFAKQINTSEQKIGSFVPLLMSVKSKEQGEIIQADKFSGIYNKQAVIEYFRSWHAALTKKPAFASPVTLVISGMFHTVTVGYDPEQSGWIWINAQDLPVQKNIDDAALAKKISAVFSESPMITFSTEIYVTKKNKQAIKSHIQMWHKSAPWKEMHKITSVLAKESDFSGTSWLWMAARQGQHKVVKALLKAGAHPNHARVDDVGPLYIAVKYGHEEVIEMLLAYGADPSQADSAGVSPLLVAGRQRDIEIIRILLGDTTRKKK